MRREQVFCRSDFSASNVKQVIKLLGQKRLQRFFDQHFRPALIAEQLNFI
jgi:hypothetical protein